MFESTNLLLFFATVLTIALIPGPGMLYVATRAASQGTKAGLVSGLGLAVGCLVHALAAASGLTAVLMVSADAFNFVKYLGAAYLFYLGVQALLAARQLEPTAVCKVASLRKLFFQGVLTDILNPKLALFFIALLPQFINPSLGNVALQAFLLGVICSVTGLCVNLGVALIVGIGQERFTSRFRGSEFGRWLAGTVFIGLGVRLAFAERN